MKKKGSSHIEIVLSFAIFVVFIILLLALFNPFNKPNLSKELIDVFEDNMMRELNVEVFTSGVMVKADITKDCFKFNTKQRLENVMVKKDSDGKFVDVKSESGNMINVKSSEKGFYYLFASSVFKPVVQDISGCQNLNELDYVQSNVREQSVVSENKIKELITALISDATYAGTKKTLGIPEANDIAFRVWLSDKTYDDAVYKFDKYEANSLTKREVLSKNIPIQLVNDKAEFKYAIMNIKVW